MNLKIVNKTGKPDDTKIFINKNGKDVCINDLGIVKVAISPITPNNHIKVALIISDPKIDILASRRYYMEHLWNELNMASAGINRIH
jgi:hypothetical protein